MRARNVGLVLVATAATVAVVLPRSMPAAGAVGRSASTANVSIVNGGTTSCAGEFCFAPGVVTIYQAMTVTWTNKSFAGHTVTRCTTSACPGTGPGSGRDPAFGSPTINSGSSFSVTFHAIGTYNYYCMIHGFAVMHGTVRVLQFAVANSKLPAAKHGTHYAVALTTKGGKAPFHWTIALGSLPHGLSLSTSGTISGTPTATGTSSFTVRVTDSSSPALAAQKALSITVT